MAEQRVDFTTLNFLTKQSKIGFAFTEEKARATNTNLVLSDSGATLKFKFCMLKNTTHADFQLKISTPGILAAIRSFGKIL